MGQIVFGLVFEMDAINHKTQVMKEILNTLAIGMVLFLSSCIVDNVGPGGPQGPQGPEGPQGAQGESGYVFEYENINFTSTDNYEVFLPYPDDFESLSSDVALVFLLWDVVEVDGVDVEVWRQIPQTIITNDGLLQYNFDFSLLDVRLFLDAQFDLDLLGALDTDDWVARVVVIPGEYWNSGRRSQENIDYAELEQALGLPYISSHSEVPSRRK